MKKKALLVASIALCFALFGGIAVYAIWQNITLSANNTLKVGSDTETVTVTADIAEDKVFYPGDAFSFTYSVEMDGVEADSYTASYTLSEDCAGVFTAKISVGGNEEGVLTVDDGDVITVTVTMEDLAERPADADTATYTLTVTLTANN